MDFHRLYPQIIHMTHTVRKNFYFRIKCINMYIFILFNLPFCSLQYVNTYSYCSSVIIYSPSCHSRHKRRILRNVFLFFQLCLVPKILSNVLFCVLQKTKMCPFTSVTCAQGEPALICVKHKVPVVDLPILVFNGKCQSSSTVPGSEHRAH